MRCRVRELPSLSVLRCFHKVISMGHAGLSPATASERGRWVYTGATTAARPDLKEVSVPPIHGSVVQWRRRKFPKLEDAGSIPAGTTMAS